MEDHGYPVFVRPPSGFILFIEARPGVSHLPVGTLTYNSNPSDPNILPDLQMLTSNSLGNGSLAVCDAGPAPEPLGGVPAVEPPQFGGSQAAANAMNDLGCRFDARTASSQACTRDAFGNYVFANSNSTVQFCTAAGVGAELAFPVGGTYLTARIRDVVGQPGLPSTIVVHVFSD